MKFQGSDQYVATQDLMLAVNAAVTLERTGHRVWNLRSRHIATFLGVVLLFSNSMGALIYGVAVTPMLWFAKPRVVSRFATIVAVFVLLIPMLRSSWSTKLRAGLLSKVWISFTIS